MKNWTGTLLIGSTFVLTACANVVVDPAGGDGGAGPDGGVEPPDGGAEPDGGVEPDGGAGGASGEGGGGGAPQGVECPGSALDCPVGTRCQINTEGETVGCTAFCEETLACGEAACCSAGAPCLGGSCKAADLVLEPLASPDAISFATVEMAENSCEVREGCVGGSGRRALLRFSVSLRNVGDVPLELGEPGRSDVFAPNFCEDSYVVPRFFRARLKSSGAVVAEGDLDARCIAGPDGLYSCDAQGLGPGAQVLQPATTTCNALDVTGVPAGRYDLEITVNPDRTVAETRFDNNSVVIPVDHAACDGAVCGDRCCPNGYECRGGQCIVPDLQPNAQRIVDTVQFVHQTFATDACEIEEMCIGGPGRRQLLQFEGRIENLGPGHLNPGPEAGNPLFEFADCHGHYHFRDFTDYRLVDASGRVVAQGHKQAFCLISMSPVDPDHPEPLGTPPPGSSGCNFLSAGWADIYGAGTPCQWVDVTDVPEGDYLLRVTVNPTGSIPETSNENNVVEVPVHVPAFVPCTPQPEICGDGIDQDCDGRADDGCALCTRPRPEVCGNLADENCNGVPDDGCVPIAGADSCATPGELTASMNYAAEISATNAPDVSLPCGGEGGEVYFHFSLSSEEVVYLATFESDLDTVLAVLPGEGCTGAAPLGCAAGTCGDGVRGASFAGRLPAGGYTVVVKAVSPGASGLVRLKFERASCLAADATVLQGAVTVNGDTTGAPMPTVSTCGAVSPQEAYYLPLCPLQPVTVSSCGLSSFPMTIEIADDACNQSSFRCSTAGGECPGDAAGATATFFTRDPSGSLGAVTIGGRTPVDFGPYSFTVGLSTASVCEPVDLGSAVPQAVTGSTTGGVDLVFPSCAPEGGPDVVYTFTAPEGGSYRFDTVGSRYDTVLHVHDGTCFGRELGCNDDSVGLQSIVRATLSAGQTVSVVVDGFSAAAGDYTLNVARE